MEKIKITDLKPITDLISLKQCLDYECHAHWLVPYISFGWLQSLMGAYMARKVGRKHKRYSKSLTERENTINYYRSKAD